MAVSDPTGTIARPLEVVERASSGPGLARVLELARAEEVERIVVGLPVTLRGEHGAQAQETEAFVEALRAASELPVESFDERFTTRLAQATPGTGLRGRSGGCAPPDELPGMAERPRHVRAQLRPGRANGRARGRRPRSPRARRPRLGDQVDRGQRRTRERRGGCPDDADRDRTGGAHAQDRLPGGVHAEGDGDQDRRRQRDRAREARREDEALSEGLPAADRARRPAAGLRQGQDSATSRGSSSRPPTPSRRTRPHAGS